MILPRQVRARLGTPSCGRSRAVIGAYEAKPETTTPGYA